MVLNREITSAILQLHTNQHTRKKKGGDQEDEWDRISTEVENRWHQRKETNRIFVLSLHVFRTKASEVVISTQ